MPFIARVERGPLAVLTRPPSRRRRIFPIGRALREHEGRPDGPLLNPILTPPSSMRTRVPREELR